MLVVRRRAGEAIIIAGDIEIEVIEISRSRVKLGVTAPREVSVTRREAAAVASENRVAAGLITTGALEADLLRFFVQKSPGSCKSSDDRADM